MPSEPCALSCGLFAGARFPHNFGHSAFSGNSLVQRILGKNGGEQEHLRQRWGRTLDEFLALSRERDPDIFFSGLLEIGRRLEGGNRLEQAAAVYAALRSEDVPSEVREQAQGRLNAMTGVGASGARLAFLLQQVARETTRPDTLIAMTAAGSAFRMIRLAAATRLSSPLHATFRARNAAILLRGASNSLGFLAETATFTGVGKIAGAAMGRQQDWSSGAIFHEWGSSSAMLLGLRVMGGLTNRVSRRTFEHGALAPFPGRRAVAMLGPQAGMFSGIVLGNRLAEWGGFHPARRGDTWLVDGLATLLQFNVAARLQNSLLGRDFHRFERGLDWHSEAIFSGAGRPLYFPRLLPVPPLRAESNLLAIQLNMSQIVRDIRPETIPESGRVLSRPKEAEPTEELLASSETFSNNLPSALNQLNQIADRQMALKALGLIYVGSQGPIRPLIFEALQNFELGQDSRQVLTELLGHPHLNHSRFSSSEVESAIFYGLRRLQAGEDVELLDYVFNGTQYGEGIPVPTPYRLARLNTEEQFASNGNALKQVAQTAKRPPAHWPLSAILANAENHALAQNFEAEGRRIRRDAELDAVTGVMNRQGLLRLTPRLEKRILSFSRNQDRGRKSDWILLVDIDHFKKVNEAYTHPGADVVLHDVAQIMLNTVRRFDGDFVFRFGGDEFLVVLAASGRRGAEIVGEKIRAAVEANTSTLWNGKEARVTISVAAVELRSLPSSRAPGRRIAEGSLEETISHASQLLLQGKNVGERNRVFLSP